MSAREHEKEIMLLCLCLGVMWLAVLGIRGGPLVIVRYLIYPSLNVDYSKIIITVLRNDLDSDSISSKQALVILFVVVAINNSSRQ